MDEANKIIICTSSNAQTKVIHGLQNFPIFAIYKKQPDYNQKSVPKF